MGWYQLVQIVKNARDPQFRATAVEQMTCPRDGEPLQTGPDGGLFCRYDGWRPPGQAVSTGSY